MPREHESNDEFSLPSEARPVDGEEWEHQRGFRHWLLENYRLLYILDLIIAYAFLILYFASLILMDRSSILSRIMFGVFLGATAIGALPFVVRGGNRENSFRAALRVRRSKKTEQAEILIAVSLWALIATAIALLFLHSRAH
jgi:hypothetical protein